MKIWATVLVLAASVVGIGCFLLGRQFPAHRFEQLGTNRPFLYDTTNGRVCDTQVGRVGDSITNADGYPIVSGSPSTQTETPPSSPDFGNLLHTQKFSLPPCNP